MNRKLVVNLICISFFVTMFSNFGASADKINPIEKLEPIEVIDQQQISSGGMGCPFFSYLWLGQGFVPSLNTLTKLEVKLFENGNPTSPITVSIRSTLAGADLTSAIVDGSIVTQYGQWIEFDFPDLSVTPGAAYFIVCRSSGGSMISYYCAEFNTDDPYPKGEAWGSIDYGATWDLVENYYPEYPDPDACFKIYGLDEPPSTPSITGETNGNAGQQYTYTIVSTDPENHNLLYYVKWGDESSSGWIGPYASSEPIILNHIWTNKGSYTIEVKAKDIYGAESDWGKLTVTMPKSRIYDNLLLNSFGNHALLFKILKLLFKQL